MYILNNYYRNTINTIKFNNYNIVCIIRSTFI